MLRDVIRPSREERLRAQQLPAHHPAMAGPLLESLATELRRATQKRTATPWERELEWNILQRRERLILFMLADYAHPLFTRGKHRDVAGQVFQHYRDVRDNLSTWDESMEAFETGDFSGAQRLHVAHLEQTLPGLTVKNVTTSEFCFDILGLPSEQYQRVARELAAYYKAYGAHPEMDGYEHARLTLRKYEQRRSGTIGERTVEYAIERGVNDSWSIVSYEEALGFTVSDRELRDGILRLMNQRRVF